MDNNYSDPTLIKNNPYTDMGVLIITNGGVIRKRVLIRLKVW
jgi:hypothetical protein